MCWYSVVCDMFSNWVVCGVCYLYLVRVVMIWLCFWCLLVLMMGFLLFVVIGVVVVWVWVGCIVCEMGVCMWL